MRNESRTSSETTTTTSPGEVWKFLWPISPFRSSQSFALLARGPPLSTAATARRRIVKKNSIRRAINQSVANPFGLVPSASWQTIGLSLFHTTGHNEASFRLITILLFTSYKLFKFQEEKKRRRRKRKKKKKKRVVREESRPFAYLL